jgi:hypothetical protein
MTGLILPRRGFLKALVATTTALFFPAIVRPASLMPIKAFQPSHLIDWRDPIWLTRTPAEFLAAIETSHKYNLIDGTVAEYFRARPLEASILRDALILRKAGTVDGQIVPARPMLTHGAL